MAIGITPTLWSISASNHRHFLKKAVLTNSSIIGAFAVFGKSARTQSSRVEKESLGLFSWKPGRFNLPPV
jgi:hypothetical protein